MSYAVVEFTRDGKSAITFECNTAHEAREVLRDCAATLPGYCGMVIDRADGDRVIAEVD